MANSILSAQFEEYFLRPHHGSGSNLPHDADASHYSAVPLHAFGVEDLVVAANISGCLHDSLLIKVNSTLSFLSPYY